MIYELLKNPDVLARAYEEVDRVFGGDLSAKPTYEQVNQLKYITQILKETLRLYPTAPAFALVPYKDEILAGKYKIKRHHQINVLLPMLHRDPEVWGETAEVFNPDNFLPEREAALPPNAYKPFGNGQRACIGRQFAMQEAALVIGMILQRFKLIDHKNYELKIKETLTLKPENLRIKVRPRDNCELRITNYELEDAEKSSEVSSKMLENTTHETPLLALYGSNMGTAEEIARRIAADAEENGFRVKVAPLDDFKNRLPKEGLLFISSASYNGLPPDNAAEFCEWLKDETLPTDILKGVTYAVFGCGNRDWASTFQAIPRFIDRRLSELGAKRLYALGEGDARDDFEGQFQNWYQPLRTEVAKELNLAFDSNESQRQLFKVEIVKGGQQSPFVNSLSAKPFHVLENRELHTEKSTRSTRHIELELPENTSYKAGDHLAVVPHNGDELINRVMSRFGFEENSFIRLRKTATRKTFLPTDETISLRRILRDYVELQEVATRTEIKILAEFTECPPHKIQMLAWSGDDPASEARYREEILSKRKSVLDLLEEFPACELPFELFLEMLAPLRPRYYSISSSPLADEKRLSITVAVVEENARSGHGIFKGVCSNYLKRQEDESTIYAFVKDTKSVFRLPENPKTPIIMIGPGTGIAPFRGFLQERLALKKSGAEIGDALLFFGCRHPEQDFIYEDELHEFENENIVKISTAFSRFDGQPKCYVQNEIYTKRDEIWQLLEDGAAIYVCGDASRMAPDVRLTFGAIYGEKNGANIEQSEKWLDEMTANGRYLVDVWASS